MRRLVLALFACLALCTPVLASDAQSELYDALDIAEAEEAMPDEARGILGDVGVEDALEPEGMLSRLADAVWDKLGSLWRSAAGAAAKLVAIALLCSLATAFTDARPGATSVSRAALPSRPWRFQTQAAALRLESPHWRICKHFPVRCCPA